MRDFRELNVWRKAHPLTIAVYHATLGYPKEEMYGLTSQTRRAAVSVPANIAEGCGRAGGADFGRFLQMAMGSASELEYHLLLGRDLGFLEKGAYLKLESDVLEVKRMLASLIKKLRAES